MKNLKDLIDSIEEEEDADKIIVNIENDIPITKIERSSPGKIYREAMDKMQVGQSFLFNKISRQTIVQAGKGLFPKEFVTRQDKENKEKMRVWREK